MSDRDASEWVHVPAPHLRIVSDELWQAAHATIEAARLSCNLRWQPRTSQYLLPGLARCAWCDAGLHVRTRTRSRGRRERFYACTAHFNRGETVCRNLVQLPMGDVDRAVLGAIRNIVRPDLVDDIVARVRQLVEPGRGGDLRDRLMAELESVEAQLSNLTEAIAMAPDVAALVKRLQMADARRQELALRLVQLGEGPIVHRVDWRAVERQARRLMADWRRLLTRHVPEARDVLKELLEGPVRFTPIMEDTRRGARFKGAIAIGGILAGNVMVTSTGVPGQN